MCIRDRSRAEYIIVIIPDFSSRNRDRILIIISLIDENRSYTTIIFNYFFYFVLLLRIIAVNSAIFAEGKGPGYSTYIIIDHAVFRILRFDISFCYPRVITTKRCV